jgi:Ca2+-binding EF-hand superfamily protein
MPCSARLSLLLQVAERIKAKFGGLSERELKEAIDEMFARVDEDGSGMIDVDELEVMETING